MARQIEATLDELDDYIGWSGTFCDEPYVLDKNRTNNGHPIYAFSDAGKRAVEVGDNLDLTSPHGDVVSVLVIDD